MKYSEIDVKLIDSMGSDLTVVNAARVSFANKHEELDGKKDEKLIKYLARHGHWSPFAHGSLQFHIVAPIFVSRQLVKHQVGLSWNEVSRRYVDIEPEFYNPKRWRIKAENIKQGSSNKEVEWYDAEHRVDHSHTILIGNCLATYKDMLKRGIAPEMARMVLPQSMMTEWYWSGTLMAFARVCNLRCKPDAQKETQDVGWGIDKHARELFPASWSALRDA